tara:strand:+ start:612 stop:1748 length:1137 start_codon:yes stop_codon:yes gene_type:complete
MVFIMRSKNIMSNNSLKWCSRCVTMSTRPRITFDKNGVCNACLWSIKKKKIDWDSRVNKLKVILEKEKKKNKSFDCLVPVSGGKDGSYVSYKLKNEFGVNPLCVTITPHLELDIGKENLSNFVKKGYDHISVNPNYEIVKKMNKLGFINLGFPYFGWLLSINTIPIRIAEKFDINLIFYGEDGEVEYGGSSETEKDPFYDFEYQKNIYLENGYDKILNEIDKKKYNLFWFSFPSKKSPINLTHWSYFENWDPYRNYLVAKNKCGLVEIEDTNSGTFTNFAQNDQGLYALHTYLMYLKFGFGRANQDAAIEIRRGSMDREQAINLIKLYDGAYPYDYIETYLDYYEMSKKEFDKILDKFANKKLFEKENGLWKPKFKII